MVPLSVRCDFAKGVCVITAGTIRYKMPSDAVSLVTTGIGVSVLAGIISGVCYVLAHGIGKRTKNRRKKPEWYCEICGTFLHSTLNILNEDLVTCSKCEAKVCVSRCARFVQHSGWICNNCLNPSQSWFSGTMKMLQPNTKGLSKNFSLIMNPQLEHSNPDMDSLRKLEKEQVRDFIEKLVNVMLGENVDNASVSMLYKDNHYKELFDRYHRDLSNTLTDLGSALHISMSNLPVTGQSPCTAHAALKQLIEKLLKEAVNVPLLEKAHAHPTGEDTTNPNGTYEDLLATAIINKVITSCQNNLPSSSANSVSSRVSSSSRNRDDKEYFFGQETLDSKWKTTDLDTSSVSSLEEWLQSETSFGSRKYVDKVTLMIKQDIEEVDTFDSDHDSDDAEYFRSSSSLLNDSEANWFLQKRHFQGTHSPVPVPMLVPDPSTDAKVLIGDKPLDDTSDLSDVGSDYEESVQPHTTRSLLVQSKNIIGGGKKNFEADVQSESSTDSGVKEVNGREQKSFDVPDLSKTDISLDDDNVDDSSLISVYSNTEKEAEYTERYASLPRQILKSSTPKKRSEEEAHTYEETKANENDKAQESAGDLQFVGGNYSKKEKEKWSHAVEMKNNPYSKENIERRVERSNSNSSSIFGPDYYARLAGKPSGGGKTSTEINGVSWPPPQVPRSPSPPLPTTEAEPSPRSELPKSPPPTSIHIVPELLDLPPAPPRSAPPPKSIIIDNGIHQALKAIVTPVEEEMPIKSFETSSTHEAKVHRVESYEVHTNTTEVTSDSDISYTNFYDVEHSQVVRKSKNEDVHIPIKSTPLAVPYNVENTDAIVKEPPVAKPRVSTIESKKEHAGLYIKAPVVAKQRNVAPPEKPILRRNLSESSLIDDSYDVSTKINHHKKDNTLISKIYKDPKVRLFALNSREEIPGSENEHVKPILHTQRSYDSKLAMSDGSLYMNKVRSYNSSDDGVTSEYESGKTGRMSFFSSEEDLLSFNSESSYRQNNIIATKNEDVKVNEFRTSSPNYVLTPGTPSTRRFIYGSQEDLLSIDEVSSIPQRKDNTLISKIYKDPNVRNFALKSHRQTMSDHRPSTPTTPKAYKIGENHYFSEKIAKSKRSSYEVKQVYRSYDDLSSAEISLETSHHNNSDATEDGYKSEDLDIEEIEKRHVVRQALGKFSRSEMNVRPAFHRATSTEDDGEIRVSVRDLRKKFENNNASHKPVISSLTARSLSKQVKESLRH